MSVCKVQEEIFLSSTFDFHSIFYFSNEEKVLFKMRLKLMALFEMDETLLVNVTFFPSNFLFINLTKQNN